MSTFFNAVKTKLRERKFNIEMDVNSPDLAIATFISEDTKTVYSLKIYTARFYCYSELFSKAIERITEEDKDRRPPPDPILARINQTILKMLPDAPPIFEKILCDDEMDRDQYHKHQLTAVKNVDQLTESIIIDIIEKFKSNHEHSWVDDVPIHFVKDQFKQYCTGC